MIFSDPPNIPNIKQNSSSVPSISFATPQSRQITCLLLDRSSSRLLCTTHSSLLYIYDFSSISSPSYAPLRTIEPSESQAIKCAAWNNNATLFAVSSTSSSFITFGRDGGVKNEFVKGDQYIRDLRLTKGHVSIINGMLFVPAKNPEGDKKKEIDVLMTWGADGTVRWWDTSSEASALAGNTAVLVIRGIKNARPSITCCCLQSTGDNNDGNARLLFTGSEDGWIRAFKGKGPWTSSPLIQYDCKEHILAMVLAGAMLVIRTKGSVLLFEAQKNALRLVTRIELSCEWVETPLLILAQYRDQPAVVTATDKTVVFLDLHSLQELHRHSTNHSITALAWSQRIDQIFVGHSNGHITVLLNEQSKKGILLAKPDTAQPFHREEDTFIDPATIVYPLAPEDDTLDPSVSFHAYKQMKVMVNRHSHKPAPPVHGFGHGGRTGSSVTQRIMKDIVPDRSREQDPREAVLAFAESAEKNPVYIGHAYKATQPRAIFDETLLEKEGAEDGNVHKTELNEEGQEQLRQAMKRKTKLHVLMQ